MTELPIKSFRMPLLPGSCGGPLAGDKRAMIGGSLISRASSEASCCVLFSGDELEAKLVDGTACRFGHADDVGCIMGRAIVQAGFRAVDMGFSLIQKSRDVRALAQKLSQHHFHGQHTAGKLTSVINRCVVHWRYKPFITLRKRSFSTCGPP